MTIVTAVTIILLIRTVVFFLVGLFWLTAGLIAWHEVVYKKRNGLTLAIRNVSFGAGSTSVMNSILNLYAAFESINTTAFVVLATISILVLFYTFWSCYYMAMKMLEQEDAH